jgi:hypothetical protein
MQRETMHFLKQQLSPDEGKEYLANLQCLAGELETAMNCIARQELFPLQESIKVQQAACSRLAHIQRGRSAKLSADRALSTNCEDSDLSFQIEEAVASVLVLNKRYAALLRHSGETLRLFAGLFRSYQGSTHSTSAVQANLQTWSCEV